MANTVNDVMNVIASPDYGIKNIAGTNQEILAILSGVHNSKNNIHAIVDDVKSLLQKLVDTATTAKKKPIEIGDKAPKVNPKNIQDILDETKGIRKSIDNLVKAFEKQGGKNMPTVAKLSDKSSQKVADAMIKNIAKQKSGGGMAALVDAFTKLRDISLKDIIFGNQKVKLIAKVFKNAEKNLKIKEKDLNAILKLINATPEMLKSLSKVGWRVNRIIKKDIIKKLSDILVGENSILTISRDIEKNKKIFNNANKTTKSIRDLVDSLKKTMRKLFFASLWAKLASITIKSIDTVFNKLITLSQKLAKNERNIKDGAKAARKTTALVGNILITSIFLSVAAVVGIPAILGAKVVSVIVDSLISTSKKLSKNGKHVSKAVGPAISFLALTGIMTATSLALTVIAVLGIPAILGAMVVSVLINCIIPATKKLSKNDKYLSKAVGSAISLLAITGIMTAASLALTAIAILGIPAILGAMVASVLIDCIIPATKKLSKNGKYISKAVGPALSLLAFTGIITAASLALTAIAVLGIPALLGTMVVSVLIDCITPATKKLSKNGKYISKAIGPALSLLAFTGIMTVAALALTAIAILGIPALLGAMVVSVLIDSVMAAPKKLSKNSKHISKAIGPALLFLAFTGIMAVASLALTAIAIMGIPALLGSLVVMGVVSVNIITFKILNKAKKEVLIGSIMMAIMSVSLLLFGIALGKITKATEKVTFKQVAVIATMTLLLAGAVIALGIPQVVPFVLLGSVSLMVMSVGLIVFGLALKKIANATENLKFKQVLLVSGSILALGVPVAGAGFLAGPIMLGSLALAALSLALRPYLKTLTKISKATENLKFKQILLVSGSILALGVPVAGAGFLAGPITLGSLALAALSLALRPYLKTLTKISKATENLKFKQIGLVAASMGTLGLAVAGMSLLTIPIGLGSVALGAMGTTLYMFVKTLKMIKDMGGVPENEVKTLINVMKSIGTFFKENALSFKVIKSARRYKKIITVFGRAISHLVKLNKLGGNVSLDLVHKSLNAMSAIGKFYIENPIDKKTIKSAGNYKKMLKPFGATVKRLEVLKNMGSVPMKLVYQTLYAMGAIGKFYIENPIEKETIKMARKYKRMLRPFGKTIGFLSKLKEMGEIPVKLVYQTLHTMSAIGKFYLDNPIEKKTIKAARKYKRMLRPFGKTIEFLSKLKEMGNIPMKLVYQTLHTMVAIGKFYVNNPIEKKAIKAARKYKRMLRPFGKTIGFLTKLKEMGEIPMKLVYQTLHTMSTIGKYYIDNPIEKKAIKNAKKYKKLLKPFGKTLEHLIKLKEMGDVPINRVHQIINAMSEISQFYMDDKINNNIEEKSNFVQLAVKKFTDMAKDIQDHFKGLQTVDHKSINSITLACKSIITFYARSLFVPKIEKVILMNTAVKLFATNMKYTKEILKGYSSKDYNSVIFALKSMKKILKSLKKNSLKDKHIKRAKSNISLLMGMATAMRNISKINPLDVNAVSDSLNTALGGVQSIDIGKVEAVTNMFNAFKGINKSENIINKFAESVKEFTSTCKDLMDAMNQQTEALSNIDSSATEEDGGSLWDKLKNKANGFIGGSESNYGATPTQTTSGVRITNVDELARTIADKINGSLSVDMPDTQIQLLINGTGGNEWTITKY